MSVEASESEIMSVRGSARRENECACDEMHHGVGCDSRDIEAERGVFHVEVMVDFDMPHHSARYCEMTSTEPEP